MSTKENKSPKSPRLGDVAAFASLPSAYRYPIAIAAFVVVVFIVGFSVSKTSSPGGASAALMSASAACICTRDYRPVCTVEGTSPNKCEADCRGLEIRHEGECEVEDELPAKCADCGKDYSPVCGDDRLTYLNACVAECSRVQVLKAGICSSTMIVKPRSPRDSRRAARAAAEA